MRCLIQHHERLALLGMTVIVSGVFGSSDFYNNNNPHTGHRNNNNINNKNDEYFFSEIRSVDFPTENDENDSIVAATSTSSSSSSSSSSSLLPSINSSSSSSPTTETAPSIVASSLLYEGGCVVSSQAIMCSGGAAATTDRRVTDQRRRRSTTAPSDFLSFLRDLWLADILKDMPQQDDDFFDDILRDMLQLDDDFSDDILRDLQLLLDDDFSDDILRDIQLLLDDEDDDEDRDDDNNNDDDHDQDDDDDADDGHSSMLSNASVRRSKANRAPSRVYANGSGRTTARSGLSSGIDRTVYLEGEILLHRQQRRALHSRQHSSSFPLSVVSSLRGGASSSDLSKKLINSAIVTLIFEACIGHILEFLKIVLQTSPPGTTYGSVYRDITNEKGIGGLWDGFIPWGVLQAVLKGGVFGLAYAVANTMLKPLAVEGVIPMKLAMALSGGIAGGFQGYVLSPTLLMKTRVMTNEVFRESMSVLQTTWKSLVIGGDIIKTEGLGSLMKGANTFATKRVFDWASRYYFADLFEAMFVTVKGSALSVTEQIIASLLGGIASTVLTLPLDVLVAKTQDAKKAGVKVSAWKLFSDELEKEGWVGLRNNYMKGFEARLLHVCLTTVVMKTIEPIVYDRFFKA